MPDTPPQSPTESDPVLLREPKNTYNTLDDNNQDIDQPSHQVNRRKNYEEDYPFIANFFFCFYCPYICRVKPIVEEDVPIPAKHDQSSYTFRTLRDTWMPIYENYLKDLSESQTTGSTQFESRSLSLL